MSETLTFAAYTLGTFLIITFIMGLVQWRKGNYVAGAFGALLTVVMFASAIMLTEPTAETTTRAKEVSVDE